MILVSVPSGDLLHADCALSLCNLSVYSALAGVKLRIQSPRSSILPQSRNLAVKEVLSRPEYTHLMFIDSDLAFPADTLTRLLKHDEDIVGGTYPRRQPSSGHAVTEVPESFYRDVESEVLVPVEKLPTGMMLIARHVLEELKAPVFAFGWNPIDQREVGEDLLFCKAARAAGFGIYAEPRLSHQLVHLGTAGFALRNNRDEEPVT